MIYVYFSSRQSTTTDNRNSGEWSPLYVEKEIEEARVRGEVDAWEVSPSRLHLGKKVGEGAFGRVYMAKADLPGHPIVALKKLKSRAAPDEVDEFLGEIAMLKLVGTHPHVVALVGCCTLRQPYCALLEYAPRGDLLRHLKSLRPAYLSALSLSSMNSSYIQTPGAQPPTARPSVADTDYTFLESDVGGSGQYVARAGTEAEAKAMAGIPGSNDSTFSLGSGAFTGGSSAPGTPFHLSLMMKAPMEETPAPLSPKEMLSYALQIAKGMKHLEMKGITHRDLAARNVLIDANGRLKVSDLGLSRAGVYVPTRLRKVPLRWLALEAMQGGCYTSKSDVWAYAVLLWEIGTLGGFPYPSIPDSRIISYLVSGQRLCKPDIISCELYSTMLRCWTERPDLRPTFSELVALLSADEGLGCRAYVDISELQKDFTFPPTESTIIPDSRFFKSGVVANNGASPLNVETGQILHVNKIV